MTGSRDPSDPAWIRPWEIRRRCDVVLRLADVETTSHSENCLLGHQHDDRRDVQCNIYEARRPARRKCNSFDRCLSLSSSRWYVVPINDEHDTTRCAGNRVCVFYALGYRYLKKLPQECGPHLSVPTHTSPSVRA